MKTKRTLRLIAALLLLAFAVTACTPKTPPIVNNPPVEKQEEPTGSDVQGPEEQVTPDGDEEQEQPEITETVPEPEVKPAPKPESKPEPKPEPKPTEPAKPTIYRPNYATGFSIEYFESGAKVLVDGGGQRILLLPKGVIEPANAKYDAVVVGPLERAVTLSTTQAGHFAKLNTVKQLKGVATAADKWYIPEIKAAVQSGATVDVGDDNEAIMALNPQVIFHGAAARDVERAALLKQAGLTCIQFDDSKEDHYLGRAEWLKFVAAFFDKEQQADQLIAANQKRVAAVTNLTKNVTTRPKVLWFYYSSSGVNWNVYTRADYVSTLVQAAGGTLLVPSGLTEANDSTAVKVQDEDFLGLLQQADIIIFGRSLASYPKASDLTYFNNSAIDFSMAPAFQGKACYVVGNDWFQATADVAPIIESLGKIMQPQLFPSVSLSRINEFFVKK